MGFLLFAVGDPVTDSSLQGSDPTKSAALGATFGRTGRWTGHYCKGDDEHYCYGNNNNYYYISACWRNTGTIFVGALGKGRKHH